VNKNIFGGGSGKKFGWGSEKKIQVVEVEKNLEGEVNIHGWRKYFVSANITHKYLL
jgi:hypothetical protein